MRNAAMTVSVMAVVISLASSPVLAGAYFHDGGTHYIDYTIEGVVGVDYLEVPPKPTTVNLIAGGLITDNLGAFEDSIVNIIGGSIKNSLWAYDRSWVDISGGLIDGLVFALDNSHVNISGGSIGLSLHAFESSQVNISGGSIGEALWAMNNSQVNISGGSIGYDLYAMNSGQVDISGGSIDRYLMPFDSAIVTIHGSNFAVDGEPFGYGELTSIYGGWWMKEPTRQLTGTLTSGEPIDNVFYISYDAKIVLVPESAIVEAAIDIAPDTLNLKSKGKWITCYIELPEGYDVEDIDVGTIKLNDQVPAESHPTEIGDNDDDGIVDLMVKFDRAAVQQILPAGDEVEITVTGELNDGTSFAGNDTIRVINKGGKK